MTDEQAQEFKKHLQSCPKCQIMSISFNSTQSSRNIQSAPLNVIQDIFNKTTRKKETFSIRKLRAGFFIAASVLIGFAFVPASTPNYNQYKTNSIHSYSLTLPYYAEIEKFNLTLEEIESALDKI
jgi:short-subunit dehydrogenase involved in D-alanine esterification of teichoic acids